MVNSKSRLLRICEDIANIIYETKFINYKSKKQYRDYWVNNSNMYIRYASELEEKRELINDVVSEFDYMDEFNAINYKILINELYKMKINGYSNDRLLDHIQNEHTRLYGSRWL